MKQHNKLVKKVDDLNNELNRKERLSHQAIAARGNMKQYLDEATTENTRLDETIVELRRALVEADQRVAEYKKKHDEMFDSVSGLNKRIDELEEHKIHLLEKLKSMGDRGGLDYIVKTQKLDLIKAKELENPVKVDLSYDPQKNRAQRDKEYEERQAKLESEGMLADIETPFDDIKDDDM